jgi:TonB family protein
MAFAETCTDMIGLIQSVAQTRRRCHGCTSVLTEQGPKQLGELLKLAALTLIVFVGSVRADDIAPPPEPPSFARAVDQLRMGGSHEYSVSNLETLARLGDARAQLMVGAIYVEGKDVTQNKVRGFAWLQIAATPTATAYFTTGAREKAAAIIHEAESVLTPAERSEADRIAADFIAASDRRKSEGLERAYKVFMSRQSLQVSKLIDIPEGSVVLAPPTASSDEPLYRVGCAASQAAGCPSESVLEGTHCTGLIGRPDSQSPAAGSTDTKIVQPEYPMDARKNDLEGSVVLLMHVDSSGWICGVALAVSSGVPTMDRAAADAVSHWKVHPGIYRGQAAEGMSPIRIDFHLEGYSIKK